MYFISQINSIEPAKIKPNDNSHESKEKIARANSRHNSRNNHGLKCVENNI